MVTIAWTPWLMKSSMAPSCAATSVPVETTLNSLMFSLMPGCLGERLGGLDHLNAPGVADEAVDHGDAVGAVLFLPLEEFRLLRPGRKAFRVGAGAGYDFRAGEGERARQEHGSGCSSRKAPHFGHDRVLPRTMVRSCCGPGDSSRPAGWRVSQHGLVLSTRVAAHSSEQSTGMAWMRAKRGVVLGMGRQAGAGPRRRRQGRAPIARCRGHGRRAVPRSRPGSAFGSIGATCYSVRRLAPSCPRTSGGQFARTASATAGSRLCSAAWPRGCGTCRVYFLRSRTMTSTRATS